MDLKKQINALIADLKKENLTAATVGKIKDIKPAVVIDKKEIIKKVEKINARLNRSGEKVIRFLESKEKEQWYCVTCGVKRDISLPRLIKNRNKEEMYNGECVVCGTELIKKARN